MSEPLNTRPAAESHLVGLVPAVLLFLAVLWLPETRDRNADEVGADLCRRWNMSEG
ncbi:hypothetical protein [Nocardiopsis xinjiangensis]|uniref:hypothetical protein n=1 Tax=Nocardiopsis xinjiangensis TaxID=124285 RepID=UPI000349BB42|nr:hypothetical protein [Nocardiopsis xinjiangensis]